MKELIILSLLKRLISGAGVLENRQNTANVSVSLIVPPVIYKASAFPVIAVIRNMNSDKRVSVNNVTWHWNGKLYQYRVSSELEPCGDAIKKINDFFKGNRHLEKDEELMAECMRVEKGTKYARFQVTEEMVREAGSRGTARLGFSVGTVRQGRGGNQKIYREEILHTKNKPLDLLQPAGIKPLILYYGDTHSHSTYTWDYYIGNGIFTIEELKELAQVAGLDWLVLTDHAYCLDEKKFEEQKNSLAGLTGSSFAFLHGEELSCMELVNGDKSNNTCHVNGVLNNRFVACKTDLLRKASAPDSQQGIASLKSNGGLAIINHPNYGTGLLEPWNFSKDSYDYTHGETGIEIMNGGWSKTNTGSVSRWVDQRLLKGERVFPFAGSDTESKNHLGECFTVVYSESLNRGAVKASLEKGRHFVTTGPSLAIWARDANTPGWGWMGETIRATGGKAEVYLSCCNKSEQVQVYLVKGKKGWNEEKEIYSKAYEKERGYENISVDVEPGCYLRAYCVGKSDKDYRAYTTPIWFE